LGRDLAAKPAFCFIHFLLMAACFARVRDTFSENTESTIGAAFLTRQVDLPDISVEFLFFLFFSFFSLCFRLSDGCLVR
jgi:hypothetical protein